LENQIIISTFKKFQNLILLVILTLIIFLGLGNLIKAFLPDFYDSKEYTLLFRFLLLFLIVLYVFLLIYLYKTARILRLNKKSSVGPAVLLILSIIATPFVIVTFLIAGIISARANKYLKELSQT